jgi:4-hydroxy-tetrahydrodipicolinate reductase
MDSLPLNLTAICQRVDHIAILRLMNASNRRGPFQKKIGSGLTVEQFNDQMAGGRMGHVGLVESIGMIMDTLGKKLVRYESSVEPVVADRLVETAYFVVQPGRCIGLRQVACGYAAEGEFVRLTFHAYLDALDEKDVITIQGKPDLEVTLRGTNGDIATIAIVVNAIRRVREAAPGLVTMRDLPIVTIW